MDFVFYLCWIFVLLESFILLGGLLFWLFSNLLVFLMHFYSFMLFVLCLISILVFSVPIVLILFFMFLLLTGIKVRCSFSFSVYFVLEILKLL